MIKKDKISLFLLQYSSIIFLLILLTYNLIFTNNFFSIQTLWNLIIQITPTLLLALGMTFIISSGGIDISVGSTMAIAGVLVVQLLSRIGLVPSLILGVIAGGLIGMINGFIISKFSIQPIIVTLATQIAGRGLAQLIGDGYILRYHSDALMNMATYRFAGIPIQLLYLIVTIGLFIFIAKKTTFARYVEAMGDNKRAAWISGISVNKYTVHIFAISGIMAALAGILTVARAGAADPDTIGLRLETTAIAAVAIGDTSMSGGKAKMAGTVIGAIILQIIIITFNMNNIPYALSQVANCIIIILAVFLQSKRGE